MRILPVHAGGAFRLPLVSETPREYNPACTGCSRHKGTRTVCMPPRLASPPPIPPPSASVLLVVGDRPSQEDDAAGAPFQGTAGRYVRTLLERLWPGPVIYTHAVRCAGEGEVSAVQVRECRGYLAAEVFYATPSLVLAFGSQAARAICDVALPSLSARGGYTHLPGGVPVAFLLNPAATFHNRFMRAYFEADLAAALQPGAFPPAPVDDRCLLVETVADAEEAVGEVAIASPVTIDCETFGDRNDRDFRILTLALSCGRDAYVWDESVVGALATSPVTAPLRALLGNPRIPKAAQAALFDWGAIDSGFGLRVQGLVACTRLQRKLIQADALSRLEVQQALVGRVGWKAEGSAAADREEKAIAGAVSGSKRALPPAVSWRGTDFAEAVEQCKRGRDPAQYAQAGSDPDVRARYCAADAISTACLVTQQARVMQAARPELVELWSAVGLGLHRAAEQMEHNGVLVSIPALRHLSLHMQDKLEDAVLEMKAYGEFDPASAQDTQRFLFTELGLKPHRRTKTGWSVDSDTLSTLDHPVAKALVSFRRAAKFKSTYADGIATHVRDDGRVHPTINLDGTETGRLSSQNPNAYNFPGSKTFEGKLCRDVIVAPPGWLLVEVDQSQIELRVAAMLSGDVVMADLFRSGEDFHLATARLIAAQLGVDPASLTKDHPLRDTAKTCNFATLYGTPPAGLAAQLGITVQQAEKIQNAILGRFASLKAWIKTQISECRRAGWVHTYWNGKIARRRPLLAIGDSDEDARATAERSSYNTPIQGTAAEFTSASLGTLARWVDDEAPPFRLVLTVYDSILAEVREDFVPEALRKMQSVCTGWHSWGVPLVVDAKVGPAWGSMSSVKVI